MFQNEKLRDCIYSIPWEAMSPQNRTTIRIVLMRTLRTPVLGIRGVAVLDYTSLRQVNICFCDFYKNNNFPFPLISGTSFILLSIIRNQT